MKTMGRILCVTKRTVLLFAAMWIATMGYCQTDRRVDEADLSSLDALIEELQNEVGMPGLAIAVLRDGKLIYRKESGLANIEHEVAVTEESIFPLYSLTKPFISVGIFSLIESGKLALDDPISKYIDGLPEHWSTIRIEHLLAHTSGLPDMAGENPYIIRDYTKAEATNRVFKMDMQFARGQRYEYNQTNFWLLKEIIEQVSQMSLSDFIIQNQFPNHAGGVLFSSDAREIVRHRVTPYFPWLKGRMLIDLPYTNGDYFYACNGLHLTLNDFILWDQRLQQNELISAASKEVMWKLFPYESDEKQFAHGWEATELKGKRAYGFSGAMTTFYRTYPAEGLSVIFLSNGFANMYNQDAFTERIISQVLD